MRIIFLCGSLEPGKDGVGDYTRTLAGELIQEGHVIINIALYDYGVQEVSHAPQYLNKLEINTVRIPGFVPDSDRFSLVRKSIEQFNPDWLSLQFVPFAFNSKGILPKTLITLLAGLGNKFKWHIMFHELWVGMQTGTGLKMRLWGAVQKHYIKLLIKKLKPQVVHTQTQVYKVQLQKLGIDVKYLPLFSNISVQKHDANAEKDTHDVQLVLFGSIHPTNLLELFAEELAGYKAKRNTNVTVIMIGRANADEQKHWERTLTENGIEVNVMGEQPEEVVSEILAASTVGISTTPTVLAEKSGTIISMLNHGLEVICLREPWIARGINIKIEPAGVHTYIPGNLPDLFSSLGKIAVPVQTVKEVGNMFLNDIQQEQ